MSDRQVMWASVAILLWLAAWTGLIAVAFGAPLPPERPYCGTWVLSPRVAVEYAEDDWQRIQSVTLFLARDGTGTIQMDCGGGKCGGSYWQVGWHLEGKLIVVDVQPAYSGEELPALWIDTRNMLGQWAYRDGGWPCVAKR